MSSNDNNHPSYLYLGLAGETGRGREVHSGLFRLADDSNEWEAIERGLPEMPAVRALAVHPLDAKTIYAGTQSGVYRSADRGEHWERVDMPDHGLPVWSILFHPHDPDVILVGCENCEIYRSDDAGERWTRLPVSVRFPEITTAPGSNPAKRVLMLDASATEPDHLYGAIEVGGTIRSTDGGEHWENLSHGQYLNDDAVDMHGVLVSRWRPGMVFGIGRAGMFHSTDGGDHWRHVPLGPLNAKGQIYCRDIREVPGNPRHLWVAAGGAFRAKPACSCAAATAATAGPGPRWACSHRTRCSRLRSTSAGRPGCRAPRMAARSIPASTAATAGPRTRLRRAVRRFTRWRAVECCLHRGIAPPSSKEIRDNRARQAAAGHDGQAISAEREELGGSWDRI